MARAFGQTSGSFGSPSAFGNANNPSNNSFGSNTFGNAAFLSSQNQRPLFGGSSTGLFQAPSARSPVFTPSFSFGQASHSFGSSSAFGNTSNSSNNPFTSSTSTGTATFPSLQHQRPLFGGSSTGIFGMPSAVSPASTTSFMFGQASGSASSSILGNSANSTCNMFATNTVANGTVFGPTSGSSVSSSIFRNTTNSTRNPFATNTVANATVSGPTSGSSASLSIFGNTTNSIINPFATNTVANATLPRFPIQRSSYSETSIGQLGAPPSTFMTSPLTFKLC